MWYDTDAEDGNQEMDCANGAQQAITAVKPVRVFITDGPSADCRKVESLMTGLNAKYLLADPVISQRDDREFLCVPVKMSSEWC